MKIIIISAAFLQVFLGAAFAADLPHEQNNTTPGTAETVFDWTGAYVGLIGGGGSSSIDWTYGNGNTADHDGDGVFAGLEAGYDYQYNNWVVGIAGDIAGGDLSGSTACPNPVFACGSKLNFLGTLRGRIGFAFNKLLIYGTGGLAVGNEEIYTEFVGLKGGTTKTLTGWTAGVGTEYAFTDHLAVKAEYRHIDLGSSDFAVDTGIMVNSSTTSDIGLVGIDYKF